MRWHGLWGSYSVKIIKKQIKKPNQFIWGNFSFLESHSCFIWSVTCKFSEFTSNQSVFISQFYLLVTDQWKCLSQYYVQYHVQYRLWRSVGQLNLWSQLQAFPFLPSFPPVFGYFGYFAPSPSSFALLLPPPPSPSPFALLLPPTPSSITQTCPP